MIGVNFRFEITYDNSCALARSSSRIECPIHCTSRHSHESHLYFKRKGAVSAACEVSLGGLVG